MGNININVAQIVCEPPDITSATWTGSGYNFSLNWNSMGQYLSQFDTVTMYLAIELFHQGQTSPYYSGYVSTPPPIPYDATGFVVNIADYDASYTGKDRIVFTLTIAGPMTCTDIDTYEVPEDTIPS